MPENTQRDTLLPDSIRRHLDRMMLVARQIRSGSMKGERRSIKHGTSIEFADYRNYTPGDDLRKLDWNVYARFDKPYVKLLEDEEDLAVHLLLDNSASMNFPRYPDRNDMEDNKFLFAKRLMASLAYIALNTGDRLAISSLSDADSARFGPARGRRQVVPMLRYAHGVSAVGQADLNDALKAYALRERRAGLVFILSDLFSPSGHDDGLNALLGRGHEIVVLHILSAEDMHPTVTGDLRLIDSETQRAQEVTVDASILALYEQRFQSWLTGVQTDLARKGVHYLLVRTDTLWERTLQYDLRRLGLVK